MTEAEHGRALVALICDVASRVATAGGKPEICVVTPLEFCACAAALDIYARFVDVCMDDGRRLYALRVGPFDTAVIPRADCPPGRLAVGGRELLA